MLKTTPPPPSTATLIRKCFFLFFSFFLPPLAAAAAPPSSGRHSWLEIPRKRPVVGWGARLLRSHRRGRRKSKTLPPCCHGDPPIPPLFLSLFFPCLTVKQPHLAFCPQKRLHAATSCGHGVTLGHTAICISSSRWMWRRAQRVGGGGGAVALRDHLRVLHITPAVDHAAALCLVRYTLDGGASPRSSRNSVDLPQ